MLRQLLWILVLLLLPLTTPPFLPLANTVVKPLAAFPAAMIVALVVLLGPAGRLRQVLFSRAGLFLLAFAAYAAVAGFFLALSAPAEPYKGLTPLGHYGRAMITVMIGICFYMAFRMMVRDSATLRRTELLLQLSLSVSVALALFQCVSTKLWMGLQPISDAITFALVDTSVVWRHRFHGLAFEPAWLASQLCLLLIPLSLSRFLVGEPTGRVRFGRLNLSLDLLFLIVGLLGITLSLSRSGMVAAFLVMVIGIGTAMRSHMTYRVWQTVVVLAAWTVVMVAVTLPNNYIRQFFVAPIVASTPVEMVSRAGISTRVASWVAAGHVFLDEPMVGVGLGNSPPRIADNLPEWVREYPEAQRWLSSDSMTRPTPKSLIMRLLAETGLVGISLFAVFVVLHLRTGGVGSLRFRVFRNCVVVALLIDCFSLDTFALPTIWLTLGLVTAIGQFSSPAVRPDLLTVPKSGIIRR